MRCLSVLHPPTNRTKGCTDQFLRVAIIEPHLTRRIYRQGMLTNVLNPKVALFFLASVSQFIATDSTNKFAAFLTLGLCFVTTATIWHLTLGWFSARLSHRLRGSASFSTTLNRTAGALFVVLGIRLAATK